MKSSNKLLRVDRVINIYNKEDDDLFFEVKIEIKLDELIKIIEPREDDPLLYDGYLLSADKLESLNEFLMQKITPDFITYYYVLEAYGIYEP